MASIALPAPPTPGRWSSARLRRRQRIAAAAAVAALHVALAVALAFGLAERIAERAANPLKVFDVHALLPPPRPEPAPEAPLRHGRRPEAEGKAAPSAPKAAARPVVAPIPVVALPPPVPLIAAPAPEAALPGERGSGEVDAGGTGAGGAGQGSGSGAAGRGSGGGIAVHAERITGRIKPADYPKEAYRAHAGGTVFVRLTVGADGAVRRCDIDESSGHPALDAATCRLILDRYRYRPARDAAGNAVPETLYMAQVWETGRR